MYVGGNDYIGSSNIILLLTFGPTTTSIDIPVIIIDDHIYELTESLTATLSFPGDPVTRVSLSPGSAQITIFDEDG